MHERVNSYRSRPLSIHCLTNGESITREKMQVAILVYEFLGLYDGSNT